MGLDRFGGRRHYLNNHCGLVTTDLDQARESMDQMWEHHRSVLKRGRSYGLRWHQTELVNTTLSYGQTPSSLRIQCGPMSDSFRISMHETGRVNHWVDGCRTAATSKRAVVHRPGQDLKLETEPFALLLLTFDGPYVRQCFQQRFDEFLLPEDWPTDFSLATPAGRALQELTRWMAIQLDRPNSEILKEDCAARGLERTLLSLFLDCVAEQSATDEAPADYSCERRVRRIEEWIDVNFADPIGIEDLAAVGGISVRSVQVAFRRLRACSPMRVVIRKRLEAAHAMLSDPRPGTTVTEIATACGFFNLGRFSERYRETFGEPPSQALARASGRSS